MEAPEQGKVPESGFGFSLDWQVLKPSGPGFMKRRGAGPRKSYSLWLCCCGLKCGRGLKPNTVVSLAVTLCPHPCCHLKPWPWCLMFEDVLGASSVGACVPTLCKPGSLGVARLSTACGCFIEAWGSLHRRQSWPTWLWPISVWRFLFCYSHPPDSEAMHELLKQTLI